MCISPLSAGVRGLVNEEKTHVCDVQDGHYTAAATVVTLEAQDPVLRLWPLPSRVFAKHTWLGAAIGDNA